VISDYQGACHKQSVTLNLKAVKYKTEKNYKSSSKSSAPASTSCVWDS